LGLLDDALVWRSFEYVNWVVLSCFRNISLDNSALNLLSEIWVIVNGVRFISKLQSLDKHCLHDLFWAITKYEYGQNATQEFLKSKDSSVLEVHSRHVVLSVYVTYNRRTVTFIRNW
jgi:hypothetical protein